MRVAVTGLDGFTGRYLREALEARGHEAVALRADVTDAAALDRAVADAAPDAVVHLAARAFVQSDDFASFYQVNQIGGFNLLRSVAAARPGATVLLASSAQVYGDGKSGLIAESEAARPANHYALSKHAVELGARFWADRLRLVVARPFNYTGRGQEERYLVPKIVAHFRARAPEIELGNIDVRRDFGDVRHVVDAYVGLLERPPEGPVNIATGRVRSVRDVIAIAQAETGHRIRVGFNPAFARPDDVEELGGDVSRLRAALPGWEPRPLEDTIRWMLDA